MRYDWNFGRLKPYAAAFLQGTMTTVEITVLVVVLGTVVGALLGLLMSRKAYGRMLYPPVDVVRAVPPLVLLLFCYYFLTPDIIGVSVSVFWVAVIALSVNLAAFVSDLVRSALLTVPAGAIDAGRALGMTSRQLRRHVVAPHVLREVLPGMTVLYIGMLKATSLASVITVREVVYTAQVVITDIARSLEAWLIVAVIYVALVVPATYGARQLQRRFYVGQPKRQAQEV